MVDSPKATAAEQMIPKALAQHWRDVPLPTRVAVSCGFGPDAVVGDLARPVTARNEVGRVAIQFFVRQLVGSRAGETADVPVFPRYVKLDEATLRALWPKGRWTPLLRAGLHEDLERLGRITYGDLFAMPGMGVQSVIEIGLRAETLHSPWGEATVESPGTVDAAAIAALQRIADADWSEQVSGADRRFAHLIPSNGQSLAAIARELLASLRETGRAVVCDGSGSVLDGPVSVVPWAERIESEVSRLKSLTLESSLAELFDVHAGLEGPRRDALLARLGWSGQRPLRLVAAGRMLGVTRERVRQIEEQVRASLPAKPTYVPALMRALEVLAQAAPVDTHRAAQLLKERSISRAPFSPDSVLAAAADLHLDVPIKLSQAGSLRVVVGAAVGADVTTTLSSVRRMIGRAGMGCVEDVAADLASRGAHCTPEDVKRTLSGTQGYRLLGGSWYCVADLSEHRDGVANACRDMLSVAGAMSVTCLWEGVKRWWTFRNVRAGTNRPTPSVDVLRAFLEAHPGFRIDDEDRARPARRLDYRSQLRPAERTMVEVLRSAPGGVLDRTTLTNQCVSRGVGSDTVSVELTYGCLFVHVAVNAWALRGTDVDPAAVDELGKLAADEPMQPSIW